MSITPVDVLSFYDFKTYDFTFLNEHLSLTNREYVYKCTDADLALQYFHEAIYNNVNVFV